MLRQPVRTFSVLASSGYTTGNHVSVTTQLPEFDFNSIAYKLQVPNGNGNADWAVDFAVQTTDDGGTTWWDLGRFATITASAASGTAWFFSGAADDNSRMIGKLGGTVGSNTIGVPHLSRLIRANFNVIGAAAGNTATIQLDALLNTIQPH